MDMNKNEIKEKISKLESEIEAARKKRELKVIGAFSIVLFVVFCLFDKMPDGIGDVIKIIVVSFFLSYFSFHIYSSIFEHLHEADKYEREELKCLKKQLSDIEKQEFEEKINAFYQNRGGDWKRENRE